MVNTIKSSVPVPINNYGENSGSKSISGATSERQTTAALGPLSQERLQGSNQAPGTNTNRRSTDRKRAFVDSIGKFSEASVGEELSSAAKRSKAASSSASPESPQMESRGHVPINAMDQGFLSDDSFSSDMDYEENFPNDMDYEEDFSNGMDYEEDFSNQGSFDFNKGFNAQSVLPPHFTQQGFKSRQSVFPSSFFSQSAPSARENFKVGTKEYKIQPTIGDGNCAFNGFALGLMGLVSDGRLDEKAVRKKLGLSDDKVKTLQSNPQQIQFELTTRLRGLAVEELKKDDSYVELIPQTFLMDLRELITTIGKAGNENPTLEELVAEFAQEGKDDCRMFDYKKSTIHQILLLDSAQDVLNGLDGNLEERQINDYFEGNHQKLLEQFSKRAIDDCFEGMKKNASWGGEPELHALVKVFDNVHLTTFRVLDNKIRSDEGQANAGHIPNVGWSDEDREILHDLGLIEGSKSKDKNLYFKRLTREQVDEQFNSHVEAISKASTETFRPKIESISKLYGRFLEAYSKSYKYSTKSPVEMGMFLEAGHWSAVTNKKTGFYDLNDDLPRSANSPSLSNNAETSKMTGGYQNFV